MTLSNILQRVSRLKISQEKVELERRVLEHWNIDITEFPIHDDLKTDDPGGDVTSNDELQRNDADAPSGDLEREDDISESEEAIENNEIQRGNEFVISESEDAAQNYPQTPSTSGSRPNSTTPTSRERITRFPIDSPQLSTKRKVLGQSKRKETERNPQKRRIKIQLTVEGQEGKEYAFIETGKYVIPYSNVVPKHMRFAEVFKCAYCNLLIPFNGKVIECGHRYCSDCLDLHISQSNDCFLRCGIEIKKSKKDNFTTEEKKVHKFIEVFCTHCKTRIEKEAFTAHNDHCSHSLMKMSEYMLEKTEALQMWKQLQEMHSEEELSIIHKHILKELPSKTPIKGKAHLISSEEAGAFRQFLNISTRTYRHMHTWLKHGMIRKKVDLKILPSYDVVVKADQKQMPCNVSFGIQDTTTGHITQYEGAQEDFNPIDLKESYRQVKFFGQLLSQLTLFICQTSVSPLILNLNIFFPQESSKLSRRCNSEPGRCLP